MVKRTRRRQREQEEKRRRDAEIKQVKAAAQQAAKERAAEFKKATKAEADPAPRRKPGRPRKNPQVQRPETIPARTVEPAKQRPAPLPSSCTTEQFAAWIG